MKHQKILGIGLIILGALLLIFSHYIADQVAEGKLRIASAQRQVNTVNSLFSHSPYGEQAGTTVTSPFQHKINEGQAEVANYEGLAGKLQIGGVILILIGASILFSIRRRD